jgi:hypothetical protein
MGPRVREDDVRMRRRLLGSFVARVSEATPGRYLLKHKSRMSLRSSGLHILPVGAKQRHSSAGWWSTCFSAR